jgi:hypothetical protein
VENKEAVDCPSEEGAEDRNRENSDKDATQHRGQTVEERDHRLRGDGNALMVDALHHNKQFEASQEDCGVKKSDQKRKRYSSRDRRMSRGINRPPDSTPRRPTVPSHYNLSDIERVSETNKRIRNGARKRSSRKVTNSDFAEGERKVKQVDTSLQLTLFDMIEKKRIFVDMHGELLCVPLRKSIRDGETLFVPYRSKSICFLIREVRKINKNHSRTI